MLVKTYMTRHPMMAEPDMTIIEARAYMGENNIRHLPIVGDGKRLLGLVTRQALLVDPGKLGSLDMWEITHYLSKLTVSEVMLKREAVITTTLDCTVEEAARIMIDQRIGSLPVLDDDGVVVGIITEVDIMTQLTELMSMDYPGVRVTIHMPMIPKKGKSGVHALVSAIVEQGWGIMGIGGVQTPKKEDTWEAVVKIRNVTIDEVVAALSGIEDQEIVDVREL